MQLLLQVLPRRGLLARTHPQAQGVEAPEDAHLLLLWQELHSGDLPGEAHAEARGQDGQAATNRGGGNVEPDNTNGPPWQSHRAQLLAQDGWLRLRSPANGATSARSPGVRPTRSAPRRQPPPGSDGRRAAPPPAPCTMGRPRADQPEPNGAEVEQQRVLAAPVQHAPLCSHPLGLARLRDGQPAGVRGVLRPDRVLLSSSHQGQLWRAVDQQLLQHRVRRAAAAELVQDPELRTQPAQGRTLQVALLLVPGQARPPAGPGRPVVRAPGSTWAP